MLYVKGIGLGLASVALLYVMFIVARGIQSARMNAAVGSTVYLSVLVRPLFVGLAVLLFSFVFYRIALR
jgi:hypothetical protein